MNTYIGTKTWDGIITIGKEYIVTDIVLGSYKFIGDHGAIAYVDSYGGYLKAK